jgi:hypothetical protein
MKLTDEEFNPKKLDVEPEGRRFERYDGDIPRTGTILEIRVTKMWWTNADDGTSMIKLLAVAENNNGRLKEFNGLPTWEQLTFKPTAAFRYQPFLQCFDIPLRDIKSKLDVEADDDKIGTPINAIGDWVVGSDDAVARIVIKRDFFNKEWQSKVDVDGWLPLEDDLEAEPEDEEEEAPPVTPSRARRAAAHSAGAARSTTKSRSRDVPEDDEDEEDEDADYDVEDEEEDDEEEAEEEAPPRRGSRARATSSSRARPARTRPASRDGSRTASASGSRRSSSGGSRTATSGSRRKGNTDDGTQDDPPF